MSRDSTKVQSVSESPTAEYQPRKAASLIKPLLILFFTCLFLGLYCCKLNLKLYEHRAPFYDSLSYNERLFGVMTKARETGFAEAMKTACNANSTNCLPFIVAAAVSPIVEPSRMVGIWIQIGLLYFFLSSLFYYLSRIRGLSDGSSLAACLAFFVAKCLYFDNGGLSDFRMDLSLFLGCSVTTVWYLTAMETTRKLHFVLLGVAAAVCCLFRATAPIYLVFALAPLLLIELIPRQNRVDKIAGVIWATVVVVLLAGWFYALNLEYLKYYYFDWNTDANAKIPFVEALKHWKYAQRSVGGPFALMLICWGAAVMIRTAKKQTISSWVSNAVKSREIDWRIGWLAVSAVVLMVGRRAGLNPFVVMPAVFGIVLFFTLPLLKQMDRLAVKKLTTFCWVVLIACILIAWARGWKRHSQDDFVTATANHLVIDTLIEDASLRKQKVLHYGVTQITGFDASTLYSTILFDRPDGVREIDGVTFKDTKIKRIPTFSKPAVADWTHTAGETDSEKVAGLIAEANARIDYLILPDKETAKRIVLTHSHNVINLHAVEIRNSIVNDESWVRVKSNIQTNENEFVEVYRNLRNR